MLIVLAVSGCSSRMQIELQFEALQLPWCLVGVRAMVLAALNVGVELLQ